MEAFVYIWTNLTDNKKYIGYHKGSQDDGYISSSGSESFWNDFNDDTKEWRRDIIFEGTTSEALAKEQDLLKQIDLTSEEYYNNARGAEVIFTDEVREKIRQHHLGGSSGMAGKKHKKETKEKIREALKQVKHTDEWNSKVSKSLKNKKKSPEHIRKMRESLTGTSRNFTKKTCEHCNNNYNPVTYSRWHGNNCKHNPNNSIEKHNIKEVKCPHCDKIGNHIAMKRWHFDNCKNKIKD